jgi:hypothetical protein
VCREQRLIIEVDGGQHADSASDRRRDAYLNSLGYRVVGSGTMRCSAISRACRKCLHSNSRLPLTLSLSPQAGRGNAAARSGKHTRRLFAVTERREEEPTVPAE